MSTNVQDTAPSVYRLSMWAKKNWREILLALLITVEITLPFAVIALQPGFDHANSLGLDFDFVVQMAWAFVLLWPVGTFFSWRFRTRVKRYLFVSYGLSPLFLFLVVVGYFYYRHT